MKIERKLNKMYAGAIALMMVSIIFASVFATRTFTDSNDTWTGTIVQSGNLDFKSGSYFNLSKKIYTSTGKTYNVSEANLQAALDDVGTGNDWSNGIVYVPGNQTITITTGIVLKKSITLDLQGSMLDVRANVDGVTMANGACLRGGTINTQDYVGTYTKAAILFDPQAISDTYWDSNTLVEDMHLIGSMDEGAGIQYQLDTTNDIAAFTVCDNVYIETFKYGILLNVTGGQDGVGQTYANSNTFSNIQIVYATYAMYLNRNESVDADYSSVDGNIFSNIVIQTHPDSKRVIFCEGRYNVFTNIFLWDWSASGETYAYEFIAGTLYNTLGHFGGASNYISNGTANFRIDYANNALSVLWWNQATQPDFAKNTYGFWGDSASEPDEFYFVVDKANSQKRVELSTYPPTGNATSVADGGTITHGLGTTPRYVLCTPSVAGEMVSVTALGATTFTVAIKKHDGGAGTTQTVYWRAFYT